ncbi:arsenate reductase ArsC, partial [Clostridium tarantellae]|nr:arsenate reductase ArsC [Clostridium tarantellae]
MAEALGKKFAAHIFHSYSAGTEIKDKINEDAVRIIKNLYGIDMNKTHKSKLISHVPKADIVIKMGCNVICPNILGNHIEDWGLEDPTGKSDEEFIKIAKIIEEKINDLAYRIKN